MNTILEQIQQHAAALPLSSQAELLNYAVYLEQKAQGKAQVRREGLAAALEKATALDPFADIADPIAWQREQRKDRQMPEMK